MAAVLLFCPTDSQVGSPFPTADVQQMQTAGGNLLQLQFPREFILGLLQFLAFFDVLLLKVVDFGLHGLQLRKELKGRAGVIWGGGG